MVDRNEWLDRRVLSDEVKDDLMQQVEDWFSNTDISTGHISISIPEDVIFAYCALRADKSGRSPFDILPEIMGALDKEWKDTIS